MFGEQPKPQAHGNGTQQEDWGVRAPSLSLPKGGGASRGIREKSAANPVEGAGSMSVPIATSSGRCGFGPQLSPPYDSGAGNGSLGLGWCFSQPQITRKTERGLRNHGDVFILSGAEDLVPELEKDANGVWIINDGHQQIHDGSRTLNSQTYSIRPIAGVSMIESAVAVQ